MWQVLRQQRLLHYGKLEEFVSLVMEMFPKLLSESQRTELTLGLQHMGPAEIGCKTDPAVETLLWELLSRLDQLLLVPDLKQTVSWLHVAPSVLEDCVQSDSCIDQLRTLLRPHRSCQQLEKNEKHPSFEECKLDYMGLSPSQRFVDSVLTNTNSQSQSITDSINCLNPTTSGQGIKAESVMDSSDCTGAEPEFRLNRCEDTEDRIQRKTGYLTSRMQNNVLINMTKEEEDGESLKMMREDEKYKEGYKKEEEKQMEGNTTCLAAQTDKLVQNRVNSEQGQQEGDDLFSSATFCVLKQPKVLIRRLENCSSSVPVSSPPHSMVTPLRGNGLLRLKKDQVLSQKNKTISPMKLLPFSSEIRMGAKSRTQKNILINIKKEEEDGKSQSLKMMREDERYKEGYRKEEEKQMEGNTTCQAAQTDKLVQNRVNSEQGQEEGDDLFSSVTLCLLKQPRVLIRRLENCSSSVPVSSPPHSMVTPLRGNALLRLKKDQVLTQKSKTISPSERPMKLLRFSSEIRMGAEVSLSSPVISLRERKTGQTVEESSQLFASSQCPFVYTEEVNLHQHIEKVHTKQLSRSLGSQKSPSRTHQHPTPPKTLPTPTQSHTGTPGTHTCSHCGKSFALLSNLKVHLRTHPGERPYSCSHCGKSFAYPYVLKKHLRTHTGERPYSCSHCGKGFIESSHLKVHLRTHTGEQPYSCSHCGKSFARSYSLKAHLRTHTGERPYSCSHCGRGFIESSHLMVHLRTHTGKRPYPCSHCGKGFVKSSHLKVHLRTHTGEQPYSCSHCGKSFAHSCSLKAHLRTHTGEHPYPCSHCGKSFGQLGTLKAHLQTHTGERPYSCSHCGKGFIRSSHLKAHLQTHTGEHPYPCSHCGKSFGQLGTLKVHLRTHTGERPYSCSHSGKSFVQLGNLKAHLRTHTGERPYPCSHCGKSFGQLDTLKQHQQTHTGEFTYSCSHCEKSFRNSGNLKVHLQTHTAERPYSCPAPSVGRVLLS